MTAPPGTCRLGAVLGVRLLVLASWLSCARDAAVDVDAADTWQDRDGATRADSAPEAGAPRLEVLEPNSVEAGHSRLGLTLRGAEFTEPTYVYFGDEQLLALLVSAQEVTVNLQASMIGAPRAVPVYVRTRQGTSETLMFEIKQPRNPTPTLERINWYLSNPDRPELLAYGGGFVERTQIVWNGRPRPTEIYDWNEARSLFSAEDFGEGCEVAIYTPPPGGGMTAPMACPVQAFARRVPMQTNGLIWDPVRQRLYASEAPDLRESPTGGRVAVIDPMQGVIERYYSVGLTSGPLALSPDGRYLYVGGVLWVQDNGKLHRLDLETGRVDLEIALPTNPDGELNHTTHIAVAPTRRGRIAVSYAPSVGALDNLVVYDDGRPLDTPSA